MYPKVSTILLCSKKQHHLLEKHARKMCSEMQPAHTGATCTPWAWRVLSPFMANLRIFCSLGYFKSQARPSFSMAAMMYQLTSICHHFSPCLTDCSKAWWLLCQPSPMARIPINQLFMERSFVFQSWKPQTWQTEFTAPVMCHHSTTRAANPQSTKGQPPSFANSAIGMKIV